MEVRVLVWVSRVPSISEMWQDCLCIVIRCFLSSPGTSACSWRECNLGERACPPFSKCPQTPSPSLPLTTLYTHSLTQTDSQAPRERERQTHSSGSRQLPSAWAAQLLQSINPQPQSLMRRFISMVLRSLVRASKGRPWLQKTARAQEKEDRKLKVPHGLTKVKIQRA